MYFSVFYTFSNIIILLLKLKIKSKILLCKRKFKWQQSQLVVQSQREYSSYCPISGHTEVDIVRFPSVRRVGETSQHLTSFKEVWTRQRGIHCQQVTMIFIMYEGRNGAMRGNNRWAVKILVDVVNETWRFRISTMQSSRCTLGPKGWMQGLVLLNKHSSRKLSHMWCTTVFYVTLGQVYWR